MSFICFFCGCAWTLEERIRLGNEELIRRRCSRCGSNYYLKPVETAAPVR
ncbi:PSPA7_2676 family Cys-rich small protein [Pseudomonas sp. GCM10022186]